MRFLLTILALLPALAQAGTKFHCDNWSHNNGSNSLEAFLQIDDGGQGGTIYVRELGPYPLELVDTKIASLSDNGDGTLNIISKPNIVAESTDVATLYKVPAGYLGLAQFNVKLTVHHSFLGAPPEDWNYSVVCKRQ